MAQIKYIDPRGSVKIAGFVKSRQQTRHDVNIPIQKAWRYKIVCFIYIKTCVPLVLSSLLCFRARIG